MMKMMKVMMEMEMLGVYLQFLTPKQRKQSTKTTKVKYVIVESNFSRNHSQREEPIGIVQPNQPIYYRPIPNRNKEQGVYELLAITRLDKENYYIPSSDQPTQSMHTRLIRPSIPNPFLPAFRVFFPSHRDLVSSYTCLHGIIPPFQSHSQSICTILPFFPFLDTVYFFLLKAFSATSANPLLASLSGSIEMASIAALQ